MSLGISHGDLHDIAELITDMEKWRKEDNRKTAAKISAFIEWTGPWGSERRNAYLKQQGLGVETRRDYLTRSAVERARLVPLEDIAEVRNGKMLCPFHEDHHPSVWIKKGQPWGYCFPCSKKIDAISYVMHTRSIGFKDAVRELGRT